MGSLVNVHILHDILTIAFAAAMNKPSQTYHASMLQSTTTCSGATSPWNMSPRLCLSSMTAVTSQDSLKAIVTGNNERFGVSCQSSDEQPFKLTSGRSILAWLALLEGRLKSLLGMRLHRPLLSVAAFHSSSSSTRKVPLFLVPTPELQRFSSLVVSLATSPRRKDIRRTANAFLFLQTPQVRAGFDDYICICVSVGLSVSL